MKKKVCIVLCILATLAMVAIVLISKELNSDIKFHKILKQYDDVTDYGVSEIISDAIILFIQIAFLISSFITIFFINRADLSELTKSTLQARRERKAARLEAEKQRKIEEAKKTLAELDDKEKVSE